MNPLLAESMIITGLDAHKAFPPPPPAMVPHMVTWFLGGMRSPATSRAAIPAIPPNKPMVLTPAGAVVARGHDAAPMIPHVPVGAGPALVPMVMAAASSKCEFGVATVKVAAGAVAAGLSEAMGLQLHCQDTPLPPLPTGQVICATNSTVVTGFTAGDIGASVAALVMDSAVQYAINTLTSKLSGIVAEGLFDFIFPFAPEVTAIVFIVAGPVIESTIGVAIGDILGGPMGWAPSWSLYTQATDPTKNHFHKQFLPTGDDMFNLCEGQDSWFNTW
jgi:hypothetical protein